MCACLPSINLLLEKHWKKKPSPNRPRTGWKNNVHRANGKAMNIFNTLTDHTHVSTVSRAPQSQPQPSQMSFDVELAMLTGQPMTKTSREHAPSSDEYRAHRMNSSDGRREGWLAPAKDVKGDTRRNIGSMFGLTSLNRSKNGLSTPICTAEDRDNTPSPCRPDEIWAGPRPEPTALHMCPSCRICPPEP